jgi:hypothetical protein
MCLYFDVPEKPWLTNLFPQVSSMLDLVLQKLLDNAD